MGSRSAQRRAITRALRVSSLLLALAGLFAMHGLGDHGSTDAPHHSMTAMVGDGHHAGHGVQAGAALGELVLTPSSGSGGPADLGALGMCIAVLLLLTAASVALGRPYGVPRRAVALPGWRPPTRGRSPDPPDLIRLSVQRC